MMDWVNKAVSLGLGAAIATKEQAEKFVDDLVKKGDVNQSESKQLVDDLIRKGQEWQASIDARIKTYVRAALHDANLTTRDEYVALKERISELERRVEALESTDSSGASKSSVSCSDDTDPAAPATYE
ncbi:phasin family protein [Paenibacillus sp. PR3]|uniref:Phasin family protein n=1 Tax=Paenibacillus terricola TaxID=2763503 RepID=A0ABR8MYQ9_9BACL|nr:phasin family protein [Paenibacillus terricola]MBD3920070.1 phasin family protein [Paenibacillus terricola]